MEERSQELDRGARTSTDSTRISSRLASRLRGFAVQFFRTAQQDDRDDAPRLPGLNNWPTVYAAVIATLVVYIIGLALLTGLAK